LGAGERPVRARPVYRSQVGGGELHVSFLPRSSLLREVTVMALSGDRYVETLGTRSSSSGTNGSRPCHSGSTTNGWRWSCARRPAPGKTMPSVFHRGFPLSC
jgi:hypothetical protein